jgi:hypothetical protein
MLQQKDVRDQLSSYAKEMIEAPYPEGTLVNILVGNHLPPPFPSALGMAITLSNKLDNTGRLLCGLMDPNTRQINVFPLAPESLSPAPQLVPESMTRRQMLWALEKAGIIPRKEMLAAAISNELPKALKDLLKPLTQDEQDDAVVTWATSTIVLRSSPFVELFRLGLEMTHEQVDALFLSGESL